MTTKKLTRKKSQIKRELSEPAKSNEIMINRKTVYIWKQFDFATFSKLNSRVRQPTPTNEMGKQTNETPNRKKEQKRTKTTSTSYESECAFGFFEFNFLA